MNNKLKFIKFLSFLIIASLALTFTGLCLNTNKVVGDDTQNSSQIVAKVSVTSQTTESNVITADYPNGTTTFAPDNNSSIIIKIKLDKAIDGEAYVKYHAEDRTACAQNGDYYLSIGGSSTLTTAEKAKQTYEQRTIKLDSSNNFSYSLTYKTSKTSISSRTTGNSDYKLYYSTFDFVIDEVTNAVAPEKTNYPCSLKSNIVMPIYQSNGAYKFLYYGITYDKTLYQGKFEEDDGTQIQEGYLMYDKDIENTTCYKQDVMNGIVNSGLGQMYISAWISIDTTSDLPNAGHYTAKIYSEQNRAAWSTIYYYDDWFNESSGWLWNDNPSSRKHYNNWWEWNTNWSDHYYVYHYNDCDWNRWSKLNIYYTAYDITGPSVRKTFIDYSSLTTSGKLRLIVKFSEPVQVTDGSKVAIIGYMNGSSAVKFKYSGGSCTDTLYFEAELGTDDFDQDDLLIHNIKLSSFENISKVGDLGCNYSSKANYFKGSDSNSTDVVNGKKIECEIDLRSPSITRSPSDTNRVLKNVTIDTVLSDFGGGIVYYSWLTTNVKGTITKDNAQHKKEIDSLTTTSYNMSFTSDTGLNGEYYLHILIVSIYNKTKEVIYERTDGLKQNKGPFLLDCIEPNIYTTLVKDTLTARTFRVTFDDITLSYEADISEIYARVRNVNDPSKYDDYVVYNSSRNNVYPNNIVYKIPNTAIYTYLKKGINEDTPTNITYSSNFNNKEIIFYSEEKALEFLILNEYKDLEVVDGQQVNGISDLYKASVGSGEYWIRYKSKNYNPTSVTHTKDEWEYFYYTNSNTEPKIDINLIKQNSINKKSSLYDNIVRICQEYMAVSTNFIRNYDLYSDINNTENAEGIKITLSNVKHFTENDYTINTTYRYASNAQDSSPFVTSPVLTKESIKFDPKGCEFTFSLTCDSIKNINAGVIQVLENSYAYYDIGFYIIDKARNSSLENISYTRFKYDRRPAFESSMVVDNGESTNAESIDNNVIVYELGSGIDVTFTNEEENDPTTTITSIGISYLRFGDTIINPNDYSKYNDDFEFVGLTETGNPKTNSGNKLFRILIKTPGYYEIELALYEASVTAPLAQFNLNEARISKTYSFYVSDDMSDKTLNSEIAKGNILLTNNVFQLSTYFYYMDKQNTVQAVPYGINYKEADSSIVLSNKPATFSSQAEALAFVKYMEYRDFQLVEVTSYIADCFNNTGQLVKDYIKADGEPQASIGQKWIKYKRYSWTTTSTETDWVYYYYGPAGTTSISVDNCSDNLKNAVSTVAQYIISLGKTVDLVDDTNVDNYGAPKLDATQIQPSAIVFEKTMTGNNFSPTYKYSGDNYIYVNTIKGKYSQIQIPLVTNVKLNVPNNITQFYYCKINSPDDLLNTKELTFTRLNNASDGVRYVDCIPKSVSGDVSGEYLIREYGDYGVKEYIIYIDSYAPCITVEFTDALNPDNKPKFSLSSVNNNSVYCASTLKFYATALNQSTEVDSLSYIAIFKYNSIKLLQVYSYEYLKTNQVVLENGEYTIVVGDRSGNKYSFAALINNQKLEVTVKIVENSYVLVSTNRTVDQIYRYEVYLDNGEQPIDKEYTGQAKRYKQGGYYKIYIEDIYGFTNDTEGSNTYNFERSLPDVTWSYLNESGGYTRYEENKTKAMSVARSLGSTFYVNTSKRLRLTLNNPDYEYLITGLEPNEYQFNSIHDYITINSDKNYTLEVYYKDYPDVRSIYIVSVDMGAPDINLSYNITTYLRAEEDSNNQENYIYDLRNEFELGDIFIPNNIGYTFGGDITMSISEGNQVDSNLISLNVTDDSNVETLRVYLNGELLFNYKAGDAIPSDISLSRYGEYNIFATDIFGNESSKSFKNIKHDLVEYYVDDNLIENYIENKIYGNSSIVFKLYDNCKISLKVRDLTIANSKPIYIIFDITDGVISEAYYKLENAETKTGYQKQFNFITKTKLGIDSQGTEIEVDDPIFSKTDIKYKENKWYKFENITNSYGELINFINMSIMFDNEGLIYLKYEYLSDHVEIDSRTYFSETIEPYYFETELSNEMSTLNITKDTTDSYTLELDTINYVNFDFMIIDNMCNNANSIITKIEMSYSDVRDFKEFTLCYPIIVDQFSTEPEALTQISTRDNGFYLIRVYNKFGNVSEIIVNRSDVFDVLTEAIYKDETSTRYNTSYTDVTKSNYKVVIEAYAQKVSFEVYLNGELFNNYQKSTISSPYTITLVEEGKYTVKAIDENYKNECIKEVEIRNRSIVENEAEPLLLGFNEKALLKDQGYTNNKISINKNALNNLEIKYVSISKVKEDNMIILFDLINQKQIEYKEESLIDAIGNLGDGEYEILFRDSFGTYLKKTVHYSNTTTLSLARRTKAQTMDQAVDLEKAQAEEVWTNNAVIFNTTSDNYLFKIDGENASCNTQLALPAASGNGHIEHEIYYVDEYGFEYSFKVHLYKIDLNVELSSEVTTVIIENMSTTKDNIKLSYTEGVDCTYTLNGDGPYLYQKDSYLYKDGLYVFTVEDKAGNIARTQVTKDTLVEFRFLSEKEDRILINGDVCNNPPLKFQSLNKDNAYIDKYYINGVLQEDNTLVNFSKAGHYSFIIKDLADNKTVFEFDIITTYLREFEYQTPNTYLITELWYGIGDGNTQNYMSSGIIGQSADKNYSTINAVDNGEYTLVMTSDVYQNAITFSFTINNNPPEVALVGCKEGEKTIENITISGLTVGDTVYIYKDGELLSTNVITSLNDTPTIKDGGEYKIVVENVAGVQTTMSFKHVQIMSTPGSVLIIIVCIVAAAGIIAGVVLRNKQKFDD